MPFLTTAAVGTAAVSAASTAGVMATAGGLTAAVGAGVTGLAATGATAATAGLIGFGGTMFATGATLGPTALISSFGIKDGILLGANLLTAGAAARGGQAAYNAAIFQQQLLRQQAERQRQVAFLEATQFEEDQRRRLLPRIRTGSPGLDPAGTPLLLEQSIEDKIRTEAEKIRAGGAVAASQTAAAATLAGFRGRAAQTAGFFNAGASLLSGARAFT